jgi:predicted exporter
VAGLSGWLPAHHQPHALHHRPVGFLPRTPTPEQQLLKDQLAEGLASRLILVGIEGVDPATRARISKQVAQQLRGDPAFASVSNGEPVNSERDRAFLLTHRYVLSPAVTPERFGEQGLRAALGDSIESAGFARRPDGQGTAAARPDR